jgi:hypothetical protein
MSTVMTALGRWVALVNFDERASIPVGFVFQLPQEFPPSDIADRFGQAVVLSHLLDLQALNAYDLVLAYDGSRELLLVVTPPLSYPSVEACDFLACLRSVLRSLFLLGVSTLSAGQVLFILVENLGVPMCLSLGGDDHRLEAQIPADHLWGNLPCLDLFFSEQGHELAPRCLLGNVHTGWLSALRQGSRPDNVQGLAHFCQGQRRALPLESRRQRGSSLDTMFLLACRILCSPFKEVTESTIQVAKRLLKRNRGDLIEPSERLLLFQLGQPSGSPLIGETFTTLIVGISAFTQGPVVDITATAERLR